MNPMVHPKPSLRARATLLLLGFALAIVLGAVGHPTDPSLPHHACADSLAHLDPAPGHHHDSGACAACHLFQSLHQTAAVDPPAGLTLVALDVGASAPAPERAQAQHHTRSFDARGPPAA